MPFGDVIVMTSPKLRHNWFILFCHNSLKKTIWSNQATMQFSNIEGFKGLEAESSHRLAIFENLLQK